MSFTTKAQILIDALQKYDEEVHQGKSRVIELNTMKELMDEFNLASHVKNGHMSDDAFTDFVKNYLSKTTKLNHPSYLAHQVAPPHWAGSLGSMIDGFTNNAMAIYEMGPAAAAIEYFLINWFISKIGWQPSPLTRADEKKAGRFAGGMLTHGGSIANLTAMTAARNRLVPDAWDKGNPSNLALLAPRDSHYSIERAAGILGIGRNNIYSLEVDSNGVVIPDRLEAVYDRLKKDGKRAFALSANACSTAVGRYDPLDKIGDFCKANDIWFHVDGAHGASALFTEKYKHLLKGIEKADSVTWDAHKLMRTPTLCAALLFRDHNDIDTAFKQEASYLFHEKKQPGFDFISRTIECTKAGIGLKLFMVLAVMGEQGLEEYIQSRIELTMRAYDHICSCSGFVCPVKPESNILCFKYQGDDALQIKIRDELIEQGLFYLSTTSFNRVRYLRLVIISPETRIEEIKQLTQTIVDLVENKLNL